MPRRYSTIALADEDLSKIDEGINLLRQLYGFAPTSRAELVRIAVREFLTAKRKEFEDKHPLGAKAKRKEGG
jgi:hypothetical protein